MARLGRVVTTLLVLLLAVGAGTGASVGAAPSLFAVGEQFDRVQFRITIAENASAEWTFHYERVLENDTETENFREFADRFNAEETDLYADFKTQARALAQDGGEVTGRNMTARNFSKRATINPGLGNDIGIVEMSFRWTAFAERQGETLVVADIFEGGLYIDSGQSLVFMTEPGLQFRAVEPRDSAILSGDSLSESESVTWQGELRFSDKHPRVVAGPETPTDTPTPTDASAATSPSVSTGTSTPAASPTPETPVNATGPTNSGRLPWYLLIGIGLLAALATIGLWRYTDTFGGDDRSVVNGSNDNPGGGSAASIDQGSEDGNTVTASGEPAVPDAELLTDEDRVRQLLREHGGRMRQSQIVEETGWSKSKVSMLLSEMEDGETINKLRIGRENIITLPGHEPEAMNSPYEEIGSDTSTGE
ncbi:MAG: helix-turn-helix transcriptional regulator [Halobacteriales archaeon]